MQEKRYRNHGWTEGETGGILGHRRFMRFMEIAEAVRIYCNCIAKVMHWKYNKGEREVRLCLVQSRSE